VPNSDPATPFRIRPIDRTSDAEFELVANRMRETLVEVLGAERGGGMYTMEWLIARARFHVDPTACLGEILLAVDGSDVVVGHTILRVESSEEGGKFGLFSTIYVLPDARRLGVASALIRAGLAWFSARGLTLFRTYTDEHNAPLIRLFESEGFAVEEVRNEFAVLAKRL